MAVPTIIGTASTTREETAMLSTVLIVLLILMLVGALPRWGYSRSWGYAAGGLVGVVLIIVLVLALTQQI